MGITKWTIYCHTHVESGRRYIGLTKKTMLFRWNQHVQNSKRKQGKGCFHFWNAIRKYGPDAFSHEVLEVCTSIEAANEAEAAWIESFTTRDPQFGFNLAKGGDHKPQVVTHRLGRHVNSLKNLQLGRIPTPAKVASLVARNKSMVLSAESRQKITDSNKSRVCADETRAKLSVAGAGRKLAPDHADKLRRMGAERSAFLKSRTHCKHGHSLSDALIRKSDGERICRTCVRLRKHKTHCKHGHSLENAFVKANGSRQCTVCRPAKSSMESFDL